MPTMHAPPRPYHHGNLRAALLAEAETILERDGIQALTLRATARAAGVTHAAPANHFGDLTGLLSDLAATGFTRFADSLATALHAAPPDDPATRLAAMGRAYVGFARAHPGLFALMFRSERLDPARPALRSALDAASTALRAGVATAARGAPLDPLEATARAAALWSLVHGFAVLLTEGRFTSLLAAAQGATPDTLLDAVLATTRVGA